MLAVLAPPCPILFAQRWNTCSETESNRNIIRNKNRNSSLRPRAIRFFIRWLYIDICFCFCFCLGKSLSKPHIVCFFFRWLYMDIEPSLAVGWACLSSTTDSIRLLRTILSISADIVNVAVTQNGAALLYAGDIMKNNGDVVLRALSSSPSLALRMCSLELQSGGLDLIIRTKFQLQNSFYAFLFICTISGDQPPRNQRRRGRYDKQSPARCALSIETLKLIADFFGVPYGIEAKQLHRAADVLMRQARGVWWWL